MVRSKNPIAGGADRLETFEVYRPLLFSIAYRMLGSVADAEDMLQDTFIRWQQTGEADIHSPKAFLVTIISRLCINHLQSARVKRENYFGQWLPEPLLTTEGIAPPLLRIDESISMAFMVLLERLTPTERAVFLLREVFDYEYPEIAAILSQNEANCRQILRRARQHVAELRQRFQPSREQHQKLLQQFVEASARGDMTGLLTLLSKDVVFYSDGGGKATAVPNPVYGADNVAKLILGAIKKFASKTALRRIVEVNGQPGVVTYEDDVPVNVISIHAKADRIQNIFIVSNPEKLNRIPRLIKTPAEVQNPKSLSRADEILEFWFGRPDQVQAERRVWFVPDPAFDRACEVNFLADIERAEAGELDSWMNQPGSALALTLLFDQFPRNVFRGTARAFALDCKALAVARHAIARGFDRALSPVQRIFLYLPFEHSENLDDQHESVRLFEELNKDQPGSEGNLRYAREHLALVERFGRFPTRNAALGRQSTPAEEAFLAGVESRSNSKKSMEQ